LGTLPLDASSEIDSERESSQNENDHPSLLETYGDLKLFLKAAGKLLGKDPTVSKALSA